MQRRVAAAVLRVDERQQRRRGGVVGGAQDRFRDATRVVLRRAVQQRVAGAVAAARVYGAVAEERLQLAAAPVARAAERLGHSL
jgi:hypothetical protein